MIIRRLYFEHFQKHVESLQKHLNEGDYVQAAEKVWGAISSLINALLERERKSIEDKKQGFNELFQQLSTVHPSLSKILKENNFESPYRFVAKAVGLHIYFYGGGRRYKEYQLKKVLEKYTRVLEGISKLISLNPS